MTPTAQRIAIAEACGWVNIRQSNTWWYGLRPGNNGLWDRPAEAIPDYLTDLNAMREAEKVLDFEAYMNFAVIVRNLVENDTDSPAFNREISATATQRAEAFLRTLGLWREGYC
jgi:hypothetical protein